MGSRSARPPYGIPTAQQPAVGVMVMEQDCPPPQILVNRHRTDGGHGADTADTSWITCLNGQNNRGKALWLGRQQDRSLGTALSFGYTQHPRNTRGCNRADATGRPCRDDLSLDWMQTAGELLDRTLQHRQVTL
eukprot:1144376-Rhodomonas_salina.2